MTKKKAETKKLPAEKSKPTEPLKEQPPKAVTKTASGIFSQIQAKTGIDNKKIDEWQKKWIKLPEQRTKYKYLSTAPAVVGEEMFAMVNDIIDFIQKEEGGQSILFKKIKEKTKDFVKNPFDYLKQKAEAARKKFTEAKTVAQEKGVQAKEMAEKAKQKTSEVKEVVKEKSVITKKLKKQKK